MGQDGGKVQAAWHQWTFPYNILSVQALEDEVFLYLQGPSPGSKLLILSMDPREGYNLGMEYTGAYADLQTSDWMNVLYGTHDLFCHCEDPALHFMYVINKNSNAPKPLKDLENLKCLLTGKDTAATPEEDDIGIGPGDLENFLEKIPNLPNPPNGKQQQKTYNFKTMATAIYKTL